MIGSIHFMFHRVQDDEPEQPEQLEQRQASKSSAIAFRSIPLSLVRPEADDLSQSPLHGKGTEEYGQVEARADPSAQIFGKNLGKSCIGKDSGILPYAGLSQIFPKDLSGRVSTSLNLTVFLGAFAVQWGLGEIISLWPNEGKGYAPESYGAAFGSLALLQLFGLLWFIVLNAMKHKVN